MSRFEFHAEPPDGWEIACRESGSVFGSADWQGLLEESFGCDSIYAWNGRDGAAISVFKAGPFSVAYLGFPAGSSLGDPAAQLELVGDLAGSKLCRITCLRVPVSPFGVDPGFQASFATNPETAIVDLQSWDLMSVSKKLRRDIRKARRSGLEVERATDPALGAVLFGMYESAIKHHGGSLRYNAEYFRGLLERSARDASIQAYIAKVYDEIAGFAIIIHHGRTSCYLHGGTAAGFRHLSPSDLILAEAIAAARSSGQSVFNFMASPADQPTLVRYKEKWGAESRPLKTYTIAMSPAYPFFGLLEKLYRIVR